MIDVTDGQRFLREVTGSRVIIAPHQDVDGLAGAAIIWRVLEAQKQVMAPPKGISIHTQEFRDHLRAEAPDALIVIDQGSRPEALLPGVPTLTIDHHTFREEPPGVYITSYPNVPGETAAHLCYLVAGEPEDLLWLAAAGEIGDHGIQSPFEIVKEAKKRYTSAAMQETVSLINAARRSSRFDWRTAFDVLLRAQDPREISSHQMEGVVDLLADREEVHRETQHAKRARPFFADPWAVIPFSSACLVHGLVASAWINRLKDHYIVAANFGYRPGYVHFSIRSARQDDLIAELRAIAPADLPGEWGHGHHGATGGSITHHDFLLLMNRMGFPPEEVRNIDHAAWRPR